MSTLTANSMTALRALGRTLLAVFTGLLAGLLAVVGGKKGVVVLPALVIAFAMMMFPYSALYAIVAVVPVTIEIAGPITVTRLVVLFAFCIVVFQVMRRQIPPPRIFLSPESTIAFLFFFWVSCGIIFGGGGELVLRLGPFFIFATVFFIVVNYTNTPDRLYWVCFTLVISGIGQGVLAIADARFGFQPFGGWQAELAAENADGETRVTGTTIHPIMLAGFMQIALCATMMFIAASRSKWMILGALLAVPFILAGFWFAYSRSSWIGMALMVFVGMLVASRFTRALALIGGGVGLVLLITHGFSLKAVIETIEGLAAFSSLSTDAGLSQGSESLSWRQENWAAALNMFKENPWFGVGFDRSVYLMIQYLPLGATAHNYTVPATPHNIFLHMLAETGFVAFGLFVSLWISAFLGLFRAARHPQLRPYALGSFAILAGVAGTFFFNPMPRDVWFTLGFVSAVAHLGRKMVPPRPAPAGYRSILPLSRKR